MARYSCIALGLMGLFFGWNAPNHYPPWPAFHLEAWAAAGVLLLNVAALWCKPAEVVAIPRAAAAICLLAALPAAQLALGQLDFAGDAWLGVLYALGAGMAVYAGHALVQRHGGSSVLTALWSTLILAGLAAFGLGMLQWLRIPPPGWWVMDLIDDRPFANFAQPNHFGLSMVMAGIAATALFEQRKITSRWLLISLWTFFAWGTLISESRAAALALLSVLSWWAISHRRMQTRLKPQDLAILVFAILMLACAFMASKSWVAASGESMRATADLGPRRAIWAHFWAAIQMHPWLGYGFNQGVKAAAEVAAQVEPSRNVSFGHNVLLDAAVWFGIPMAATLLALWLFWMRSLLVSSSADAMSVQKQLVIGLWVALAVQSMLEFPYAHAYFLLPVCLMTGVVSSNVPTKAPQSAIWAAPWIVAASTGVLLAIIIVDYLQLESGFRAARFQRAHFAGAALSNQPTRALVLNQLAALNDSARIEITPQISDGDVERLAVLARRFHILSIRLEYAQALALSGQPEKAETQMRVIRSVQHPDEYAYIERYWLHWKADHLADINNASSRRSGRTP